MAELPPLRVSKAEYDREVEQLERWLAEYERKWRDQYRISARVRYWETRLLTLTSRFEELRTRGWVYLRGPERKEYLRLRDLLLPRARQKLAGWHAERGRLAGDLIKERLEIRKLEETIARKEIVPAKQLIHAKIIIYTIVSARPPKRYRKRFQGFFNVDALRDVDTGEIDYSAKLTQKEIDHCIDVFYAAWNWAYLPTEAQEPRWIESGEWETIDEPKGADLKQLSVRENEEETYSRVYRPPEVVYEPSEKEIEEMMALLEKEEEEEE